MVANFTVTLDKSKLDNLIRNAPETAKDFLDATAFQGEAIVKLSFGTSPSSPGEPPGVDTGALRSSIHVEEPDDFVRLIAAGTEYAPYLELGTTKMAARPFMLPMVAELEAQIADIWRQFVDDAL